MNDMKVLWTDLNILKFLNYIKLLFLNFNKKFYLSIFYKTVQLSIILNKLSYYSSFLNFKNINIFKFQTLADFTAINYPGFLEEFELAYFILSYKLNFKCFLKIFENKEDLIVSLNELYANSNWLEREVWDLFGTKFIYHQDLRRILTDYGFVGHPLLKLFPLTGFIDLRYDDSFEKIVKEIIELAQAYRYFIFNNPWINIKSNNTL